MAENTLDAPDRIRPEASHEHCTSSLITTELNGRSFSVLRIPFE